MEVYELESMENLLYVYIKGKYFILGEQMIACSKSHVSWFSKLCVYVGHMEMWSSMILLTLSQRCQYFVTKSPDQTLKIAKKINTNIMPLYIDKIQHIHLSVFKPGKFYSPLIFLDFWTGEDKKRIKQIAKTVKILNFRCQCSLKVASFRAKLPFLNWFGDKLENISKNRYTDKVKIPSTQYFCRRCQN